MPQRQTRWRLWVFCDYYTVCLLRKVKSNDVCLADHSHFMHSINIVKTSCGQPRDFSFKIWDVENVSSLIEEIKLREREREEYKHCISRREIDSIKEFLWEYCQHTYRRQLLFCAHHSSHCSLWDVGLFWAVIHFTNVFQQQ